MQWGRFASHGRCIYIRACKGIKVFIPVGEEILAIFTSGDCIHDADVLKNTPPLRCSSTIVKSKLANTLLVRSGLEGMCPEV